MEQANNTEQGGLDQKRKILNFYITKRKDELLLLEKEKKYFYISEKENILQECCDDTAAGANPGPLLSAQLANKIYT